jgi:segregation and condensation protein A
LEIFSGPLDLLLYLVRKEEVDIYDIPIAKITDQYVKYVDMLKNLDIDVASDFLVMAATLMEIKSAMLLPKVDPDAMDISDIVDPRADLVRQLLEYKRFKDAANQLHAAVNEHQQRFCRPDNLITKLNPESQTEMDLEQVSVWDLLEAFDAICKATGQRVDLSHIKDDTPIDLYQIDILNRLQQEGPLAFKHIFESSSNRLVMIGQFLALLELVRGTLIWIEQSQGSPDLYVRALTEEPAELAVQKMILAVNHEEQVRETPEESQVRTPIDIVETPPPRASRPQKVQDPTEIPGLE